MPASGARENDAVSIRLCIGNQTEAAGAGRKAGGKVAMPVRASPKVGGAIEREGAAHRRMLVFLYKNIYK